MKYKSCKYIQNGIAFRHDSVFFCNKFYSIKRSEKFHIPYTENFYEQYIKVKEETVENCKKGVLLYEGCNSCPYAEEKDWDDDTSFKEIEINHWFHCNCGCCYCSMLPVTKGKMTIFPKNSEVKLFPIIKRMLKEKMIHPNAFFSFVGGEITVLKEFPAIMKLLLKQKEASYGFCFNSNGIKYEKLLSKALEKDERTSIFISIDAGSKEMFKLIKRKDKYKTVLNNLKHYLKDAKNNSNRIVVKYIIVPNVNDSKEEIDKWIAECKKIGIKTLQPAVEFCSKSCESDIFTEKQYKLYNYMKEQIIANGFEMITYDWLEEIVKNIDFEITKK